MRTNIEIDDALMAEAMEVIGGKTKKQTVEHGLRMIVQQREQIRLMEELRSLRGKLTWEGDLDSMRRDA